LTPLFLHIYSAPCSVESWHCAIGILGMQFWCLLYNIYYQIFEISASQLPNFPVGSSTYARIKIVCN
jgi:hypothetical protein